MNQPYEVIILVRMLTGAAMFVFAMYIMLSDGPILNACFFMLASIALKVGEI